MASEAKARVSLLVKAREERELLAAVMEAWWLYWRGWRGKSGKRLSPQKIAQCKRLIQEDKERHLALAMLDEGREAAREAAAEEEKKEAARIAEEAARIAEAAAREEQISKARFIGYSTDGNGKPVILEISHEELLEHFLSRVLEALKAPES